jgi:DNA-binding NtrC family response regulator
MPAHCAVFCGPLQGGNMAKIMIMDDNRSTSTLLKKELEREGHQVDLSDTWQWLSDNIVDPTIDLVLIHQDDSEWTTFNRFKKTHQDIPAILYVMRDYSLTNIVWIVKAVQNALEQLNKLDNQQSFWCGTRPAMIQV